MRLLKELAITFLVALLIFLCSMAALWQFHKGENRTRENQKISRNTSQPPSKAKLLAGIQNPHNTWRRYTISGFFDDTPAFLAKNSYNDGIYGFEVFNQFALPSGEKIWIDRGWIVAPGSASHSPHVPNPSHSRETITIRLRNTMESKNVSGSLYATAPVSGHTFPVIGYYGDFLNGTVDTPLTEIPLPDLTTGPHYAYALQWLLFGCVLLIGRIEMFRRRRAELTQ